MTNKMISDFAGRPRTEGFARAIDEFVAGLGEVKREQKAQLSYGRKRKFLWLWAYEQTADGTLYLNVTLDRRVDEGGVHKVTQTSANRWNHHVEVKDERTARSAWLRDLIRAGFEFAGG